MLLAGVQGCYAQKKSSSSNYNYERTVEIIRNDGDIDEALKRLNPQLEYNSKHVDALLYRAMIYKEMSESDKAIADYSSAYDNARKEKASQYNIAEILGSRAQIYYFFFWKCRFAGCYLARLILP